MDGSDQDAAEVALKRALENAANDETRYHIREALQHLDVQRQDSSTPAAESA